MDVTNIINSVLIISVMGLIFGASLGFAGVKLKIEVDPKLDLLKSALPGANCGACGFVGCEAYANAIFENNAPTNACPVGGADVAKNIADIMGVEASAISKKVAFVKCNGTLQKSDFRYDYNGMQDCLALSYLVGGGSRACDFGCLGGGNCVNICEFDAIKIIDGVAVIDADKCTACAKCVTACPKHIISIKTSVQSVIVNCSSFSAGKTVRTACKVGCIACKICEKACEFDAIKVSNNLAVIDADKCTACNKCVEKCPTKAIAKL